MLHGAIINLAEIAEGPILLLSLARVTFHDEVARHLDDRLLRAPNLLLSLPLLLSLLALA